MKIVKKICVVILAFSLIILSGCVYPGYRGDYPELCSVAWDNIPLLYGYIPAGEIRYDASMEILETDDYGRVLFTYSEEPSYYRYTSCYVLIMLRVEEEYAYFYADDCYVFVQYDKEESGLDVNSIEIETLKQLNDWGKSLNLTKMQKTKIRRKKAKGKIKVNDDYFESIVKKYYKNSDIFVHPKNVSFVWYFLFLTTDSYGRELYAIETMLYEYTEKTEICYNYGFLVVVNPNKSYDLSTVIRIEDLKNTQEDVKSIKLQNGWNTPL